MVTTALNDLITVLNRRDDIQAVPLFSGTVTYQYISSWLTEADSIASIHKWAVDIKKSKLSIVTSRPSIETANTTNHRISRRDLRRLETSSERSFQTPGCKDKQIIKLENVQQILLKGTIKPIRDLIFQRLPSSNVT